MRCFCALAVAILVASSALVAQPASFGAANSRPVRLLVGGGANVPIGDFGDSYDAGFNVQGALLINLGGFPLRLRTDVQYARMPLKELAATVAGSAYGEENATLFGGLLNLTLPLGVGPVRPYVMAGLGAFNVDPAQLTAAAAESSLEFAINGGAGLQIRLLGIDAFVEARLSNIFTDKGAIDTKSIQMLPITFGLIF
jgi:opacity protein-like surface antigen